MTRRHVVRNQRKHLPKFGAERWIIETIDIEAACDAARANGWDGDPDGLLDHCDCGQAVAERHTLASLATAIAAARAFEQSGKSLFGSSFVYHERYEPAYDDRGYQISGGSWESVTTWEVTREGEPTRTDDQ